MRHYNMNSEIFRSPKDPDIIPEEWLWERIRNWRNQELASTDWTQLLDSPTDKEVWSAYRQALRDMPEQSSNPEEINKPNFDEIKSSIEAKRLEQPAPVEPVVEPVVEPIPEEPVQE